MEGEEQIWGEGPKVSISEPKPICCPAEKPSRVRDSVCSELRILGARSAIGESVPALQLPLSPGRLRHLEKDDSHERGLCLGAGPRRGREATRFNLPWRPISDGWPSYAQNSAPIL